MDQLPLNSLNGAEIPGNDAADPGAPVFVLCMGRSGSTLLRFLLDAHPDLACPPETSLPALCAQLAVVWSLIEGAPLAQNRGDAPPVVPDASIAGIRRTMDMMIPPYLARRAGKRFCDKSLGSARFADLLLRVYPGAKFLCLFRHPMDFISSALDACPWGLNGYGFDAYISGSPGNAVLALARYWLDGATAIAAAEDQHPESCYRLRYEDLVSAPEEAAAGVFDFIGVPRVPGISEKCFTSEHERFGPADHKIWHTSAISSASVGRGASIPAGLIPQPLLRDINTLAERLGYAQVDERWGTAGMPADLRAPVGEPLAAVPGPRAGAAADAPGSRLLAERLATGLVRADDAFSVRWASSATGIFMLAVRSPSGEHEARWSVDVAEGILAPAADSDDDPEWSIVGSPRGWEAVLLGEVNLAAALRSCQLRYCDQGETDMFVAQARISMVADLLGLAPRAPAGDSAPGAAADLVVPA
jgi:hypothetical protein